MSPAGNRRERPPGSRTGALPPLMLLGAGVMQIPVIREAQAMGGRILGVDGNPGAPGAGLADWFLPVDLRDEEGLIRAAEKGRDAWGVCGVLTVGTDFSAAAAAVAEALGWPGLSREAALNASRKDRMRRCFDRAGVPSPGYCAFDAPESSQALSLPEIPFGYPRVVKPVDNMGARGIRRVDLPEEMAAAVSQARRYARGGRVIVEEYIEGPEYSLDALVSGNNLTPMGLADRHIRFEPYFIEMGHTLPSQAAPELAGQLENLLLQGAKALGIEQGMVKGDLKMSPRGPVMGEMAARLSGGYMSGWTYPGASGRSSLRAALRLAAGWEPLSGGEPEDRGYTAAERAYISIPGRVAQVLDREFPRDYHFPRLQPGERAVFPRNNVEKGGNIIAVDSCRRRAVRRAEEAAAGILLRLEPGDAETARFLLESKNRSSDGGADDAWPPWCFPLAGRQGRILAEQPWMESPAARLRDSEKTPLYYRPFPGDGEVLPSVPRGWHGESLQESLARLEELTGIQPLRPGTDSPGAMALNRILWQPLFRGGLQGALWIIDTLRAGGTEILKPYVEERE